MIKPAVTVIGGGMITHDQILPSLYHLQRLGVIGDIAVCAQHSRTVKSLVILDTDNQTAVAGLALDFDRLPHIQHERLHRADVLIRPKRGHDRVVVELIGKRHDDDVARRHLSDDAFV